MHETEKPAVHADECVACGVCAENCAHGAITVDDRAHVDYDKCKGWRPLHRRLPDEGHAPRRRKRLRDPGPQGERIRAGRLQGPPVLPHLAADRRLPVLRLLRLERRARHPGRRHVRVVRPGPPSTRPAPMPPTASTPSPIRSWARSTPRPAPTTSTPCTRHELGGRHRAGREDRLRIERPTSWSRSF